MSRTTHHLGLADPPGSFRLVVELNNTEAEEIEDALTQVDRLEPPFGYLLVERNFEELASVHQFAVTCVSLGSQFATVDRRRLVESVMSAAVNWLTSIRLYLDHTETDLTRRFSKDGEQFVRFREATRSAYDSSVGYRFIYRFRNYVQHCGLPLSTLDIGAPSGSDHPNAIQHARLLLDRDALLRGFNRWSSVESDIRAMPRLFPLMPLAEAAMDALREVKNSELRIELDEAIKAAPAIDRALDRLAAANQEHDGLPCLVTIQGDLNAHSNLAPRPIHAELIRELSRVAQGEKPADELIRSADHESEAPPRLDPRDVARRFHADSRGVQILRTWFEERRPSPRFLETVDTLIAQDGGPDPVIMGLVNVSIVLAHMAAATLGCSADTLVMQIMDRYALGQDSSEQAPPMTDLNFETR